MENQINQIKKGIGLRKSIQQKSDPQIYYELKPERIDFVAKTAFDTYFDKEKIQVVLDYKLKIAGELEVLLTHLTMSQEKKELLKAELNSIPQSIDRYMNLYTLGNNRLMELDKLRFQPINAPIAPIHSILPITQRPVFKEPKDRDMSSDELLNMKFDTFTLSTELGRFLGQLERFKLAFALTGDSGAGKSYFSFGLAKLFQINNLSVKYFSLEEGVGQLTKEKIILYQLKNLQITGEGKLHDVRTAAKEFDVIIVDSFQKLNCRPEEFDKLRHDFPTTIFIIIFQKTTNNTVRGGSQIVFDSSAIINIEKREDIRIAVMEKSRYGTTGWQYDITEGSIIKEN